MLWSLGVWCVFVCVCVCVHMALSPTLLGQEASFPRSWALGMRGTISYFVCERCKLGAPIKFAESMGLTAGDDLWKDP